MLELAGIAAGIQIIKETYTAFSALQEVRKDQALLDKLREILDLQATLLDAKAEILTLREQLQEHEQAKKYAHEMKFDEKLGVYRGKDDAGNDLVFCTKCWVEKQCRAPLKLSLGAYSCAACRTLYSCLGQRSKTKATSSVGVVKPRRW